MPDRHFYMNSNKPFMSRIFRRQAVWAGVIAGFIAAVLLLAGFFRQTPGKLPPVSSGRIMRICFGNRVNTLDPALAADIVSARLVVSLYDTPLQYDYTAKPYKLVPSMLRQMPESSLNQLTYTLKLRDDLRFQDDPCFPGGKGRQVDAADLAFSFMRIADQRLHSPGYWLFRDKIEGLNEFREISARAPLNDMTPYDSGCPGLEVLDQHTLRIKLTKPCPRLLYALAMAYAAVVPREAVEFYGDRFAEHPVGSGPFKLTQWIRDYRIVLDRNPGFRTEYFLQAENPTDRVRPLPLLDRIECLLTKQALAAWLMFLKGDLDMSSLGKDDFDTVVDADLELSPALERMGIELLRIPAFQINYIAFCFADPVLADNLKLRQAISLAYNTADRVRHFNNAIIPANGPIPPGVPGYDPDFENPFVKHDLAKARELMVEAGYPRGIDPATGEALELSFDLGGTTAEYRQLAELMIDDMRQIGVNIKPVLNNKPRFFQKMRQGELQLFRIGWVGDYPDAENFLQLFYGPNAGGCNRAFYRDETFDGMYEEIVTMPDSPERTAKYAAMAEYVTTQCPWIFESHPISYQLVHSWLQNFRPHDFALNGWKFLAIDAVARREAIKTFKPLSLEELNH